MVKTLALGLTLALAASAIADEPQKSTAAPADSMSSCPMHAKHMAAANGGHVQADGSAEHGADVDGRHDTFGMSHATSTHSFRLFADGGAIELRANDGSDRAAVDAIRAHLQQVAAQFRKADFSTPAFVHGYRPDGVARMERARAAIDYRYESLDRGGRIRITTKSAEARSAIHDFLRFQVTEHRTANTGRVEDDK